MKQYQGTREGHAVKVTVDGPESSQPTTLDFVVLR